MKSGKRKISLTAATMLLSLISLILTAAVSELLFSLLLCRTGPAVAFELPPIQQPHPVLGYEITRKDGAYFHKGLRGDGSVWEKVYTIKNGMRITPVSNPSTRDKFLAMFGCSFVFGWACNDDETLPARLAEYASGYMPYNFGDCGKATQAMYWKLKTGEVRAVIAQSEGIGMYFCPGFHVRRVNLMMPESVRWTHTLPEFISVGDELLFVGSMGEFYPYRMMLHKLLYKSSTLRYANFNIPLQVTEAHWDRLLLQIVASERIFKDQFTNSDFIVVLLGCGRLMDLSLLAEKLKERGIRSIDITSFIESAKTRHVNHEFLLPCGHPSPFMHDLIARHLAAELALQ